MPTKCIVSPLVALLVDHRKPRIFFVLKLIYLGTVCAQILTSTNTEVILGSSAVMYRLKVLVLTRYDAVSGLTPPHIRTNESTNIIASTNAVLSGGFNLLSM